MCVLYTTNTFAAMHISTVYEKGAMCHTSTPHLGCTVSRGPSVSHFELLPALSSLTGHIQVDHAIKVCHPHLPPTRAGAGVDGVMRAAHWLPQENVGCCCREEEDKVVDLDVQICMVVSVLGL